ncbi:hypothetical protein ZIOFF_061779 [Zingiber officinale]|uniref:Uncharacterized protein n=1 Tax=Zingiber officinale TaxID=94328 RepID=A0A8J5F8X6_ZINOF|nr:hypothetical protein ZIOFF_061779 [Zingiber officinale]
MHLSFSSSTRLVRSNSTAPRIPFPPLRLPRPSPSSSEDISSWPRRRLTWPSGPRSGTSQFADDAIAHYRNAQRVMLEAKAVRVPDALSFEVGHSKGFIGPMRLKVATFIVQKILLDDVGLRHICASAERFFAVGSVLGNMVASLADQPSTRLLKHIIRCYLRLSDNQRACGALCGCLPEMLKDGTFNNCLRDDPATRRWLT